MAVCVGAAWPSRPACFVTSTKRMLPRFFNSDTGKMPAVTWDYAMLGRMRLFYDSSKAIRELGYTITPFEETVAKGVAAAWRINWRNISVLPQEFSGAQSSVNDARAMPPARTLSNA